MLNCGLQGDTQCNYFWATSDFGLYVKLSKVNQLPTPDNLTHIYKIIYVSVRKAFGSALTMTYHTSQVHAVKMTKRSQSVFSSFKSFKKKGTDVLACFT